jgi:hypothetical protein
VGKPQIQHVQKAFSPVAVFDQDYWNAEALSNANGDWPATPVALKAGAPTTRTLEIFNDTFSGERVDVGWQLRQGSPTGRLLDAQTISLDVPLGRHAEQKITFTPIASAQPLYLVLSASKPGSGQLFQESDERLSVN